MLILTSLQPIPKPIFRCFRNLATFYTSPNAEPLRANFSLLTSPSSILYSEPGLLLPVSMSLPQFVLISFAKDCSIQLPVSALQCTWSPVNPLRILVYYMVLRLEIFQFFFTNCRVKIFRPITKILQK